MITKKPIVITVIKFFSSGSAVKVVEVVVVMRRGGALVESKPFDWRVWVRIPL